jgi:GTPase SAR1 family protein
MAYIETSAALNVNIDKVFEMLSGKIYQIYKQSNNKKSIEYGKGQILSNIHENNDEKRKKRKCCE